MAYRLYALSVCDTKVSLQLQLPHVALYKCYAFTFYLSSDFYITRKTQVDVSRPTVPCEDRGSIGALVDHADSCMN